jgi:hypothetical protein
MSEDKERIAVLETKMTAMEVNLDRKEKTFLEKYKQEYDTLSNKIDDLKKICENYEKKFLEKKGFLSGATWAIGAIIGLLLTLAITKIKIALNWLFS